MLLLPLWWPISFCRLTPDICRTQSKRTDCQIKQVHPLYLLWQIIFMVTWKARLEFTILGIQQVPVQNQAGGEKQLLVCGPLPFFSYITGKQLASIPTGMSKFCPHLLQRTACLLTLLLLLRDVPTSSIGGCKEGTCASSKCWPMPSRQGSPQPCISTVSRAGWCGHWVDTSFQPHRLLIPQRGLTWGLWKAEPREEDTMFVSKD